MIDILLGSRGIVLAAAALFLVLSSTRAVAQIETDGTVGTAVDLPGPDFEIPGSLGSQSGGTLFHSFSRFGVPTGGSATFTPDGLDLSTPVDLIVSRVTGGELSTIDGLVRSTVGEQHFLFVNPAGVVFGANASVSVPGSFHVTTADEVEFADGSIYSAIAPGAPPLSLAPVTAFGFLGADVPAPITVRGSLEVGTGNDLTLVGGSIDIVGPGVGSTSNQGVLASVQGDIGLIALGSSARVTGVLDSVSNLAVEGATILGDLQVLDNANVSASTISPIFRQPAPGALIPPEQLSGTFRTIDGGTERLANVRLNLSNPGENDVFLGTDSAGTRFYLQPVSRGADGAGAIRIIGHDLSIVDSDVSSQTAGDGAAGGIEIDLDGDLTIQRIARDGDVGLLTRSGIDVVGGQSVLSTADGLLRFDDVRLRLVGSGDAGPVSIVARGLEVEGGGRITATSLGAGQGGDVDITATDDISIRGFSTDGVRSAIFSNAQSSGDAGDIRMVAGDLLSLSGGGGIINQTERNGDGGTITIDVARLEVLAESQIDSSTSGNGFTPADGVATTGDGGTLDIRASQSITVAGDSQGPSDTRISSFSGRNSAGQAGTITLSTPSLTVSDGAAILATTRGAGDGGDIILDAGELSLTNGATVAAASDATRGDLGGRDPGAAGAIGVGTSDGAYDLRQATLSDSRVTSAAEEGPPPPTDPADTEATREGNITFTLSDRLELRRGSLVEASVGEGLGGSVRIANPRGMILGESSAILAQSRGNGQGGRIEITTGVLIQSPDSPINADAGQGLDGEVIISSPITQVEGESPPLEASLLDPSSLIRSACAARAAGEGGSFRVASAVGLPPSIEHYLRAPLFAPATPEPSAESAFRSGRYAEAASDFARIAQEAVGKTTAELRIRALIGSADASLALGNPVEARHVLAQAAAELQASAFGSSLVSRLGAIIANQRANLAFFENDFDTAQKGYGEAVRHAAAAASMELQTIGLANGARAALESGELDVARKRLLEATAIQPEELSARVRGQVGIHLSATSERLARAGAIDPPGARAIRLVWLRASWQAAAERDDPRARSLALGHLGALYADEDGRASDALRLQTSALQAAEQADARVLAARWSARRAQLLARTGEDDEALAAWRYGADLLDEGRPESLPRYGVPLGPLAATSRPIYLGLVDALLRRSRADASPRSTELVREARSTMERYRAVELREYFEDACIADLTSRTLDLDRILEESGRHVAVVYPVVLPDRLELILSVSDGIERFGVDIDETALAELVGAFRRALEKRTTRRYMTPARQLHELLIAPLETSLERQGIETLVFVPGPLFRGIPMAALHDGESFLVERYALGLTPGLSLVDPRPVDLDRSRLLLAGVSDAVQGFDALPGVRKELTTIRDIHGGDLLLDTRFDKRRFERRLKTDEPAIVHIASHAVFTGSLSTSFVLSHDDKIGFEELGKMLSRSQFRDQPVELLILSACATSSGNDRASMGLTGLAVRAGARSAMGSLWSISDEATQALMTHFYEALAEPGLSKAEALRRAQRALIEMPEFRHPYYWSTLLLVSNWM